MGSDGPSNAGIIQSYLSVRPVLQICYHCMASRRKRGAHANDTGRVVTTIALIKSGYSDSIATRVGSYVIKAQA